LDAERKRRTPWLLLLHIPFGWKIGGSNFIVGGSCG
jgi:hypothetical protein